MTNPRAVADRADDDIEDVEEPPYAPTEDDLPDSDGMPLESERHVVQMNLLVETAKLYFENRPDVYVGANMFVYYSLDQRTTHDFRGPDVFVVTGTTRREHKSWVVWQEDGKAPNVVIELLSDSTRRTDMIVKKDIYATRLRVPEYFWYHPFTTERAGFVLHGGRYEPIEPNEHGGLPSRELDLTLMQWPGVVEGIEADWLRWAMPDGTLLPTRAEAERERAEAERERAEAERERAEAERERAERAEQEVATERRRIAELEERLARYEQRGGPDAETGAG
ncbi:MAG: Uma2 family endonuclease [Chloroflexi bacterium]|nr:Uma2 family endonuclease [Chloroflexota bacterium]